MLATAAPMAGMITVRRGRRVARAPRRPRCIRCNFERIAARRGLWCDQPQWVLRPSTWNAGLWRLRTLTLVRSPADPHYCKLLAKIRSYVIELVKRVCWLYLLSPTSRRTSSGQRNSTAEFPHNADSKQTNMLTSACVPARPGPLSSSAI